MDLTQTALFQGHLRFFVFAHFPNRVTVLLEFDAFNPYFHLRATFGQLPLNENE